MANLTGEGEAEGVEDDDTYEPPSMKRRRLQDAVNLTNAAAGSDANAQNAAGGGVEDGEGGGVGQAGLERAGSVVGSGQAAGGGGGDGSRVKYVGVYFLTYGANQGG